MLYNTLRDELDKYFVLTRAPAADTVRLRVALTQVQGANVAARVVTTVIPQLRMLSTVSRVRSTARCIDREQDIR